MLGRCLTSLVHACTWASAPHAVRCGSSLQTQCQSQGMNLSVDTLHAAMQRVRSEVLQPYGTIRMQTTQMSNLHRTTDMLRHVLHRLKLIAKLKVRTGVATLHADFSIEADSALNSHAVQDTQSTVSSSRLQMWPVVHLGQSTSRTLTESQGTCLRSLEAAWVGGMASMDAHGKHAGA